MVGLLIAGVVADLAGVVSGLIERSVLANVVAGQIVTTSEADANDLRQLIVGIAQGVVVTLTVTAFLLWFYRAYRNLTALGASDVRFGYGWAIGGWFVPILSLWRPKQIANDIWRGSANEDSVPKVFLAWWFAFLVSGWLYPRAARRGLRAETLDELREANSFFLAADIASVVAGVLALVVVIKTTRRQSARAKELGLVPREDPTPVWRRRSAWAALTLTLAALAAQAAFGFAVASGTLANVGSEPTPRPPSAAPQGALLADDFSIQGVWVLRDTPEVTFDYVDGAYRILLKQRGLWSSRLALRAPAGSLSVEADVVLHAGRVRTDFYGVSCFASSRGSYMFGISPDGYHTIAFDPGGDQQLDFRRLLEQLAPRFGSGHAVNRVRAECVRRGGNTTLTLSVDGRTVATTIHRGNLGDFVGAELFAYSENGGIDVRFDNLIAREAAFP